MKNYKITQKVLFYAILLAVFVLFLVLNTVSETFIGVKSAIVMFIIAWLVHSNYENKFLLKSLSVKYDNSQQMLKNICKYCPDLISYKDYKRRYLVMNEALLNLIGVSENDVIGKTDADVLPIHLASTIVKYSEYVLKSAKSVSFKICFNTKDGGKKYFNTFMAPMIEDNNVVGIMSISRDITKEEELKKVLMQKQYYMNSILDNLPFVAFLKDLDGKIVGANKRLEELSGIKCSELVGMSTNDVFKNEKIFTKVKDDDIIRCNKTFVEECKFNLANAGEYWYRIEKSPIKNKDGQIKGITVFVRNIEQEKIIETHKETFVATLTHDLKTPTIAQIRSLELLLGGTFGKLGKEQSEMISQTLDSCRYMLTMISDVLSTYKYENGDARLVNEDFDFYNLAKECCVELANLACAKGQKINLKCEGKPPLVYGDRTQLKRVVMNLVSNSISHGYDGSDINVVIEQTNDGIVFTSNNKSPDIPDEILDKVFEKYVSGAAKFNKVGTGLGLYLSQRIVSAHLGSMIASSKNNNTSFGFIIPHHKKAREIFSLR